MTACLPSAVEESTAAASGAAAPAVVTLSGGSVSAEVAAAAMAAPTTPGERLARFAKAAKDQLLASDPTRFQALTQLLARAGTLALGAPSNVSANPAEAEAQARLEAELVGLLSDHPRLLSELRALIGTPAPKPPPGWTSPTHCLQQSQR